MKCPSCGRECIDESNYCFYCGYSFREEAMRATREEDARTIQSERVDSSEKSEASEENVEETSMSKFLWMIYFALLISPVTYPIFFIVTLVWAFGNGGSKERKSFARALTYFFAIVLVISLLVTIFLISAYGVDGAIEKLTNGMATNADEYRKLLYGE